MKIILINGRAGSGKTTFSKLLKEKLESEGNRVTLVGNADTVREYARDYFGLTNYKTDEGRRIMIGITEMFYATDNFYFEKKLLNRLLKTKVEWDYVIVHDWRYINTFNYFRNMVAGVEDVTTIQLQREGDIQYNSSVTGDRSERLSVLRDYIQHFVDNNGSQSNLDTIVDRLYTKL